MIGTAAAADNPQSWQQPREPGVERPEFRRIAIVQLGRLVQFGVAFPRGIGPHPADPRGMGATQLSSEMRRMGTIDHEEQRTCPGCRVDFGNGVGKALARSQVAIGLDREGQDMRQARRLGRARDADGLGGIGHRDRSDHVDPRRGQRFNLRAMDRLGRFSGQGSADPVAVPGGPDDPVDHHRHGGGLVPVAEGPGEGRSLGVDAAQADLIQPHGCGPAHVRAPGRRVEDEAGAPRAGKGKEALEPPGQGRPALGILQQDEGREVRQFQIFQKNHCCL